MGIGTPYHKFGFRQIPEAPACKFKLAAQSYGNFAIAFFFDETRF